MAEKKVPTLDQYKNWVKEHLQYYIKDEKALDDYMENDETIEIIERRYKKDVEKYRSGKVTARVFREGCVASVGYCLYMLY